MNILCHNHGFPFSFELLGYNNMVDKMLDHYFGLYLNGLIVTFYIGFELFLCLFGIKNGIILNGFFYFIIAFVGGIISQYI